MSTIVTKATTADYRKGYDQIDWGRAKASSPEAQASTEVDVEGEAKIFTEQGWVAKESPEQDHREVEVLTSDGWVLTDMMSLKNGDTFRMFDITDGVRQPVVDFANRTQWVVEGDPFLMGNIPGVMVGRC